MPGSLAATPLRITDHQLSKILQIDWADGRTSRLPHGLLRARCRCAACEQVRRKETESAPDPGVHLSSRVPVGEHGLNLGFSDGHARGIYPWTYLRDLAPTTHT